MTIAQAKAEVIENMPAAEYHRLPHFSQSRGKAILRSPAHCKWEMEHGCTTPAMVLGEALHHAVFTPDAPRRYGICPDGLDRRTKEGKAAWAALQQEFGDSILKADDLQHIERMRHAIHCNRDAHRLLAMPGKPESTILFEIEGVPVKARMDYFCPEMGIIVDLKTTRDASPDAFSRSIYALGYHTQAACYTRAATAAGTPVDDFRIIAVENDPDGYCGVAVYLLEEEAVVVGDADLLKAVRLWKQCQESGEWPGYVESRRIGLPKWAYAQALAEVA